MCDRPEGVEAVLSAIECGCRIEQPDLGYALECQASGADYFLLYCPPGLGFFCIEPVSHPVNAHHLPGRPGLRLLEQGQSTQLDFTLKYSAHGDAGLPANGVPGKSRGPSGVSSRIWALGSG